MQTFNVVTVSESILVLEVVTIYVGCHIGTLLSTRLAVIFAATCLVDEVGASGEKVKHIQFLDTVPWMRIYSTSLLLVEFLAYELSPCTVHLNSVECNGGMGWSDDGMECN